MTKDEIRIQMKGLRDSLTMEERKSLSKEIQIKLYNSEAYQNCNCLFTYVSFRSEVDTKDIIHQAILDHKKVFAPKVKDHSMEFYEIQSLQELITSNYGILEPVASRAARYKGTDEPAALKNTQLNLSGDNQKIQKAQYPFMLLPGLAFDRQGNRIGYGAGYYDRYLERYSNIHFFKAALAYDFQLLTEIPSDAYDWKADSIFTPIQYIRF